ncbi:MAG: hypothetical protein OXC95_07170 [Dehalococcoidia bacterium]|nr:hypothetical protein [Dehalococcoidia bacterium]
MATQNRAMNIQSWNGMTAPELKLWNNRIHRVLSDASMNPLSGEAGSSTLNADFTPGSSAESVP